MGCSLFILKAQKKLVYILVGVTQFPTTYYVCITEKIKSVCIVTVIQYQNNQNMTSRELCLQTEKCTVLLVLPLTSPCSILYSLLACSDHAKLQVVHNLYFQDR